MISRLVRRHNRAIAAVSGVAICLYFLLPNPDVARGVLIGGLLAIFYLGFMQEQLAAGVDRDLGRVRGRMFGMLLVRLAVLAVGLGFALWLSETVFWSAVVALGVMYCFLVLVMSRELCRGKASAAGSPPCPVRDGAASPRLEDDDESVE